ncbi:hypothetical protein [Saccharopolyspora sp. CA-218241]|uniref:hypothetical protein n=1 Tax=Saccharopolyspora sp. CA-218241 TaxID=3240027 RepID=UPI003D973491
MPLSLAVAGPVAALIGLTPTFLIAAVIPLLAALVTIVLARLPKEELAHPLTDPQPEPAAA